MPRTAKLSRNQILERLSAVFEQYGYEGASLKMLAEAAELSKASLYHHFPRGKEDMAAHVLGQAGVRLQRLVLAPLASKQSPGNCLEESLEGTAEYYSGNVPVCLMNSLLLGDGASLFQNQISDAVGVWRRGLAECYSGLGHNKHEAEAWASYALERIQGALILCKLYGSRATLETCLRELEDDVRAVIDT